VNQRTIFLMRFIEEMELQEICEATGMQISTVKTHLHRAVKAVRLKLGGEHLMEDRHPSPTTSAAHLTDEQFTDLLLGTSPPAVQRAPQGMLRDARKRPSASPAPSEASSSRAAPGPSGARLRVRRMGSIASLRLLLRRRSRRVVAAAVPRPAAVVLGVAQAVVREAARAEEE
jgi:hypothetical protein